MMEGGCLDGKNKNELSVEGVNWQHQYDWGGVLLHFSAAFSFGGIGYMGRRGFCIE